MQAATPSLSRLALATLACGAAAALAMALGVGFGVEALPWGEVLEPGSVANRLVLEYRLPRVVLAALVGAALAASGAALQSLTRNALADPFVLGVSGGAALGSTLALAFGLSGVALLPGVSASSLFAMLGAVGATALVLGVGRATGGGGAQATLLTGVIFNAFALAAITFIKALVAPDKLGEVLFFLAGSLGQERWSVLAGTALLIGLSLAALFALSGRLNLLSLGDDDAASLGVDVGRTRLILLLASSLAVASAVALSGLVGFVGLLVPHAARLLFGADNRVLVPTSALLGAAFLVLADLAARVLFRAFNAEPPVGVLTALLGGPAFLALAVRGAQRLQRPG
jgi:iron complex transport system permease protein